MKYWWLVFLFSFSPFDGLQRIALRNQYVQQAQQAYNQQQYLAAAGLYEKVRNLEEENASAAILLNLAHSYFQLREYSRASPLYRALLKTAAEKGMQSLVATQLSIIEAEEGNYTKALALSKQAMTTDETNQAARYNYELLQKYLILHPEKAKSLPPPRRSDQNQGDSNRPNQNGKASSGTPGQNNGLGGNGQTESGASPSPNPGQEGAERQQPAGSSAGDTRSSGENGTAPGRYNSNGRGSNQAASEEDALLQTRFERLKKLQLSPEKARQLLDAMRQEEAQYLHQIPRKKKKKADDGNPDW